MKSETKNSIAKADGPGGPIRVAEKDPLHNIDLDLMNALKQAYEEAVKDGFQGSQEKWQDSLSLGALKRLGAKRGGLIKMSMTKN